MVQSLFCLDFVLFWWGLFVAVCFDFVFFSFLGVWWVFLEKVERTQSCIDMKVERIWEELEKERI